MKEITKTELFCGTDSLNTPSTSEIVPFDVPFTVTLAPTIGRPASSRMVLFRLPALQFVHDQVRSLHKNSDNRQAKKHRKELLLAMPDSFRVAI